MTLDPPCVASPSQTAGPFFHLGLRDVSSPATAEPMQLVVSVTDGNADPLSDAVIELWYVAQSLDASASGKATFARASTDSHGRCEFVLAPPARSAPHISVCLFARGLLRQLYTRLYFEGDAMLDADALLALVPPERRHTLLARRETGQNQWLFSIRLQGADETVFLAL